MVMVHTKKLIHSSFHRTCLSKIYQISIDLEKLNMLCYQNPRGQNSLDFRQKIAFEYSYMYVSLFKIF